MTYRPEYQTPKDTQNEQRIMKRIESAWNRTLIATPQHYSFDFIVKDKDDNVECMIEYKRRHHDYGTYPDVMLSVEKLAGLNKFDPIPVFFIVEWNNRLAYTKLKRSYWNKPKYGGRTKQTRDKLDIEIVANIPISDFKEIK